MDDQWLDRIVQSMMTGVSRRGALIAAGGALVASQTPALAQDATPAAGATPEACKTTTPEENGNMAADFMRNAWTKDGQGRLGDWLDPDYVHHWGWGGDSYGPDDYATRTADFLAAFPDIRTMVNQVIATDDSAVVRWTVTGTHTGDWMGFPATNESVSWSGVNIFSIQCGKFVEGWAIVDGLSLLRQIGLTMPGEATPTP